MAPVDRSDAYLKHRAKEMLLHVVADLRLGRSLGMTPYQLKAWEREHRRYHGTPPDERGRWHRIRTDLRDARMGTLPAPMYVFLSRMSTRLYQEEVGYNFGEGHTPTWRTLGYHWDVGFTDDRYGTWFTLTVNGDNVPEFTAPSHRSAGDRDRVFRADPSGFRALMAHVNESVARLDARRPMKPIKLWQSRWGRDGEDPEWRDVR